MDELAHDLSLALHESSKALQQTVRRHNRKRKGKARRSSCGVYDDVSLVSLDFPNRSEASAASDAETIFETGSLPMQSSMQMMSSFHHTAPPLPNNIISQRKLMEATTDSEDQCGKITKKLSALALPNTSCLVSGGDLESDSVNELYSEKKSTDHARRRRRAKLNASPSILIAPLNTDMPFPAESERKNKPRPHVKKKEIMDTEATQTERKRPGQRMDSDPPGGYLPCLNAETGYYDVSSCSESSLLTSDGEETCDDRAGEADDEQSDWFHDLGEGPTYGVPIIRTTSRGKRAMDSSKSNISSSSSQHLHLKHIIQNTYPQLSSGPHSLSPGPHSLSPHSLPIPTPSSTATASSKLKRPKYGKYGRPIRTGYRRLKAANKHVYPSSSDQSQDCLFTAPHSLSISCPTEYKSPKRRRQFVPSDAAMQISESKLFPLAMPEWGFTGDRPGGSPSKSSTPYRTTSNAISITSRRRRRALVPPLPSAKRSGSN